MLLETVWEMPKEFKDVLERFAARLDGPAGSSSNTKVTAKPEETVPKFDSEEDAKEAFRFLLIEAVNISFIRLTIQGVAIDWTWEQTMRAIISKPMYRALNTLAKRKQAFQDYIEELKIRERDAEKIKAQRDKENFRNLMESHPEINGNTRYRRVCDILGKDPLFLSIDERTRLHLFDEWSEEMRKKEKEEQRIRRKEAMDKFRSLLKSISEIKAETPFKNAQEIWKQNADYQADEALTKLDPIDVLTIFEDHVKALENEYYQQKSREKANWRREERKNRDNFRTLLKRLRADGAIFFDSKWKDVYPFLKDEPFYLNMLGQSGSTPLDLFWDLVVELEEQYQNDKKVILEIMKKYSISVKYDTKFDDFIADLRESSSRMKHYTDRTVQGVFNEVIAKLKEEKRRQEKKLRKKMDAFKNLLKRVDPPITVQSIWEDVRSSISSKSDFEALDEGHRIEVFNKYIKRLKEKDKHQSSESEEDDDSDHDEGGARKKRRERDSRDSKVKKEKKKHRRSRSQGSEDSEDSRSRTKRKQRELEEEGERPVKREKKDDRDRDRRDERDSKPKVNPTEEPKAGANGAGEAAPRYQPDESEEEGEIPY
ncbi:hypothetical protein HDU96_000810 [Phlyctochytrium bullatum]|nr:hypothetical protein HDU96_000810 [Phlyctochytrium bullatum]